MHMELRHQPSFAVARILLDVGQGVRGESGAMAAMSMGIDIEAKMQGGFFKALKRSALSGDSFFVTTFRSQVAGGWVDLAANLPGDLAVIDVTADRGIAVTRGCWLANDEALEMNTGWGGMNNVFGGEGGFVARLTGTGQVVVAAYGALDLHTLEAGQSFTIDSGHIVAYDDGLQMRSRTVSGLMTTMKSGEGMVVDMTGPGRVWTQSRNPDALVTWLTSVLPFSRS
jgi:uncharacterized protein (TIGR00266 family)